LNLQLSHAREHVPWYQSRGLMPLDSLEGLCALSVLTKEDVQGDWRALQARQLPIADRDVSDVKTLGTTGQPLHIRHSASSIEMWRV
jgi:phenylacetate-coenzyme A ligase PaaK-like adenylate-forming protein